MKATRLFLAFCVTLAGSEFPSALGSEAPRFVHFQREAPAITNADSVLSAFRYPRERSAAQQLIGSEVIFVGGAAPPGDTANLILADRVLLRVVITPKRDVRPHAVMWEAEVRGRLTRIDFEHRVITITSKPSDWRVRQTM